MISFRCAILGACIGWWTAACAPLPAGAPGTALDVETASDKEEAVKAPFMFREASLPTGFPAPGPVGQILLKEYPAYRAARVASGDSGDASTNSMFRTLFNHIKKNDIAMTAPVEMTYGSDAEQPATMAFLYGDQSIGQVSRQDAVEVVDLPAVTVVSITIRGGYNDANYKRGLAQLHEWLAAHPGQFEIAGAARYLGYNSPFVPPFLRIGEVQLPVRRIKS